MWDRAAGGLCANYISHVNIGGVVLVDAARFAFFIFSAVPPFFLWGIRDMRLAYVID